MALKLPFPFPRFENDNMRNRAITAVVVGVGHVLAVMLIWALRLPTERESIVEEVGNIFFFEASTGERHSGERSGRARPKPLALKHPMVDVSELLQFTLERVATQPRLPESTAPSGTDWQNEITEVASDVIEDARVEAGLAMNRPPPSASLSPLQEKPHTFEWIAQHSHEVIDKHGVPQWVLVQPCESEFLVQKPDCTVELVLPHGILFEFMTEQRDATMQYGGPNAIP
jgi:hypothetical protein